MREGTRGEGNKAAALEASPPLTSDLCKKRACFEKLLLVVSYFLQAKIVFVHSNSSVAVCAWDHYCI